MHAACRELQRPQDQSTPCTKLNKLTTMIQRVQVNTPEHMNLNRAAHVSQPNCSHDNLTIKGIENSLTEGESAQLGGLRRSPPST